MAPGTAAKRGSGRVYVFFLKPAENQPVQFLYAGENSGRKRSTLNQCSFTTFSAEDQNISLHVTIKMI